MYKILKLILLTILALTFSANILVADGTRILKLGTHLDFGIASVGTPPVTRELTISNEGDSNLTIFELRFHENIIGLFDGNWSGVLEPGQEQNISITFTPLTNSALNGLVYVESDRTNLDIERSRNLKVHGEEIDDCTKILRIGKYLDFGSVSIGDELTKNLEIFNDGTCDLTVNRIRFHEKLKGVYDTSWTGGVIEANSSKLIPIKFTPTEAITSNGLVYIESDRTNTGDRSRLLKGKGLIGDDINTTIVIIEPDESNITKTICSVIPDIDSKIFKKVDIMFLVDISGSYSDDLATFRTQANNIINSFATAGIDVKIGVSSFSDYPISPYGSAIDYAFRLDQALTTNYSLVTTAINNLSILSGNDSPESQLEALFQTGEAATGWREGALPIIFLATDAGFHNSDDEPAYPGHGLTDTIAKLQTLGIKVFGLQSGGSIDDVIEVANLTDGSTFNLSGDSSEVVTAINDAIIGVSTDFTVALIPDADTAGIVKSITPDILGAHPGDVFTNVNSSDRVCFNVVFGRGIYEDEETTRIVRFNLKVLAEEVALIEEIPVKVTLRK